MKGWVGWLVADGLPTLVVTHQLQVERRTGKVRRPETDVLPLSHATNTGSPGKGAVKQVCVTIKISNVRKSKMTAAAILKNTKTAMSATAWLNFTDWCRIAALTALSIKKFEFQKLKMADGLHFENRQIVVSPQLLDWFWWNCMNPHIGPHNESTVKKKSEFLTIHTIQWQT